MDKPLTSTILLECSKYLYEIELYKITKNTAELYGTKLVASNKPLKFTEYSIVERTKQYVITKTISLIGAPKDYILEYESNREGEYSNSGGNSSNNRKGTRRKATRGR